ncbi:uncharacterized protein [Lepeophtheirus salmonis]|uniref:uncharacterized protein n=1 Tax=Lepeophtheirus salmonis TaxID=72036 RepID=UPI003AF39289
MSEIVQTLMDNEDKKAPLIVVSNRLPFVLKRNEEDGSLIRSSSAGGLVTAVAPVVIACKGIWVGWTGLYDFKEGIDVIPESSPDDKNPTAGLQSSQAFPVTVEPKLFDDYYNGCCNGIFWPLFHSMPDRAVFEIAFWKAYTKVNKAFAMTTMNAIRKVNQERMKVPENKRCPSPIVWLHDYHLMKAANIIRDTCKDEGIEIRMAFFLHIPFPTFDILRICPWVDEILMGVLGCDLVGFHIDDYCINFLDCCQRCLGLRTSSNKMWVEHIGRVIHVKPLPIGIPYTNFENLSKIAPPIYQPGETKIILGVDRLDYTKGLVARLKALVRLFEKYPKWITKVILVQIAVPSRTEVLEYQELKKQIDILVGQINGDYSTASWAPIRYIYSSMPQHELVGFYRDARVALVTPLRDGMNLVGKEFVASQKDADPGVLILSPFAGAGNIMHEALMANPYESDNVADTINRALEMPLDERQLRMNQLKKREKKMDVDAWVKMFLLEMDNVENKVLTYPKTMDDLMEDMFEFEDRLGPYVEMSTKLGIILDFDGTLSCLARTPGLAMMAPETKKVLERFSNMSDVHIAIISGRSLEDLRHKVGVEKITYAGNHGLEIMHPDGHTFSQSVPQDYKDRLSKLKDELTEEVTKYGAWVEDKDLLMAWHYREVDYDKRAALINQAKKLENNPPCGWDRGSTCIQILRTIFGVDWEERVKVIYAGDSTADEIAIERLKGVAYTFRVNNEDSNVITKTSADFRINGTDGVLKLLKFLERRLLGRSRRTSAQSVERELDINDLTITEGKELGYISPKHNRSRSNSFNSSMRRRTASTGAMNPSLCKATLAKTHHTRINQEKPPHP